MEKKYYWLKLHENFFRDKPIKRLRSIAGGDTYTIIYLKMLLASANTGGKFYLDGMGMDPAEEVALEIDENAENVRVTISFLKQVGLAEEGSDEVTLKQLPEMVGSESSSAARVRKHRSKQKALQCNNGVTSDININIYKEIDIDKEKEIEKEVEGDNNIFLPPSAHPDTTSSPAFSSSSFSPPSVDEVVEFCKANAKRVNPYKFHAFYTSKGWKVNGERFDWRARARVWDWNALENHIQKTQEKFGPVN